MTARGDDKKAEQLYIQALEVNPEFAPALGNYALLLDTQRKDDVRAEEYYLKALAANPRHANNLCNYTQHLIGRGKFAEAMPLSSRAWGLLSERLIMGASEVAFSRWLLSALVKSDEQPALGRLKTLLQTGFGRYQWSFERMLEACRSKLTEKQNTLERVYDLFMISARKANATNCRLVLSFLSQFFHSRLHFSSQANERSTTHRCGMTTKVCNSFRLATSTDAPNIV